MFLGLRSAIIYLYPFLHEIIHFSQVTMRFLTPADVYIFLQFLITKKKNYKNGYTRKQPTHFTMTH